jgi:hypothetical protein
MMSNYRNTRTSNGLKKGLHIDWDRPKPKPKNNPKFDSIKFLQECINDKEAYGEKERAAFRKVLKELESIILENESLRQDRWQKMSSDAL